MNYWDAAAADFAAMHATTHNHFSSTRPIHTSAAAIQQTFAARPSAYMNHMNATMNAAAADVAARISNIPQMANPPSAVTPGFGYSHGSVNANTYSTYSQNWKV